MTYIKDVLKFGGTGIFLCLIFACNGGQHYKKTDSVRTAGPAVSANVEQWLTEMITANIEQIKLAQVAEEKSLNIEVKNIAGILDIDHQGFINEAKDYARQKHISLPPVQETAGEKKAEKLSKEKPIDFDKKWCEASMEQHKQMINRLEIMNRQTADTALKTYINAVLPRARMHLDRLMICNSKMKT